MIKIELPPVLTVKTKKLSKGKFFAEIIELGIFTEADSIQQLPNMVNDLIYTYYDIPSSLQKKVHYKPNQENKQKAPFLMYATPDFYKNCLQS